MKQQKYLYIVVVMVAMCTLFITLGAYTQGEDTMPPLRISKQNTREAAMTVPDIKFTGHTTFSTVDDNGDGLAEAVIAEVEVKILTGGEYSFIGTLKKNGQVIANRPFFESAISSTAFLNEGIGLYTIFLRFSGEQIFQSGENGPYQIELFAVGANKLATTLTVSTPACDHTQFSEIGIQFSKNGTILTGVTDAAIDETGDGKFDFVETTLSVEVRTTGKYRLQGTLSKGGTSIINVGISVTLTRGTHTLKLPFSGLPIRRSGLDGPYEGIVNIYDANDHALDSLEFVTQPYRSVTFRALLELDGTFNDQGVDTNGNDLFDILRIDFGANFTEAGTFLVRGVLTNQALQDFVFIETLMTLSTGSQTLTLNFQGPLIHKQKMEGPYEVEVLVQNPDTFEDLDRVQLGQMTKTYRFTDFEPLGRSVARAISLTGKSFDKGVDTDGNGLFDELHVDVEVKLTTTDFYEWSARLVDVNGTEIGFDSRKATLSVGTASINFVFDGKLISQVDGPYFVKGLLMFGKTGANLVNSDVVAKIQTHNASKFEVNSSSVGLRSFTTVTEMKGIRLTWKTISIKENHAGFRLWRAIKDDKEGYAVTMLKKKLIFHQADCIKGELTSANTDKLSQLISAAGISKGGSCYSFVDTSVKNKEGTYYYVLEDIDISGKRIFHCDAIAAVTIDQGLTMDLEATKDYCRQVTGSRNS